MEALNARLNRSLMPSSYPGSGAGGRRRALAPGRRPWQQSPDAQRMSQLKASVEKLSRVNDANVNRVKLIEQALHGEGDRCRAG